MRTFCLLLCRKGASEEGCAQRRKAWVENRKKILFVSDEDLSEMIQIKWRGDDPTIVLDLQMDECFTSLAP